MDKATGRITLEVCRLQLRRHYFLIRVSTPTFQNCKNIKRAEQIIKKRIQKVRNRTDGSGNSGGSTDTNNPFGTDGSGFGGSGTGFGDSGSGFGGSGSGFGDSGSGFGGSATGFGDSGTGFGGGDKSNSKHEIAGLVLLFS